MHSLFTVCAAAHAHTRAVRDIPSRITRKKNAQRALARRPVPRSRTDRQSRRPSGDAHPRFPRMDRPQSARRTSSRPQPTWCGEAVLAAGDLLTIRQALEILPVGRSTLYALCDSGELPCFRVGATPRRRGRLLIHRDDLTTFLENSRQARALAPQRVDVDAILKRLRSTG